MGNVQRIAAFSHKNEGGNPAGVLIGTKNPTDKEMLQIAKDVGYSETAFLEQKADGWRIRYFSPEMEIPFCGHATIATGAAMGELVGPGDYKLQLNQGTIDIRVSQSENDDYLVRLQSPGTWSAKAPQQLVEDVLALTNLEPDDIHEEYPASIAFAGAKHLLLVLKEKEKLGAVEYQFDPMKSRMMKEELTTINIIWPESGSRFRSRNLFAPGGVYEDPATGAAAAAFAGYLRDINWSGSKKFEILQGEEMGYPSRLIIDITPQKGEGIFVSGETRYIRE